MIERMKDAAILAQMGFGEKMFGALQVALIGMGVTFVVLILLLFAIKVFTAGKGKKTEAAAAPVLAPAPAAAPATVSAQTEQDEEVVAAIIAAITMMQGSSAFKIRNISPAPVPYGWIAEGRRDVFSSRKSQI